VKIFCAVHHGTFIKRMGKALSVRLNASLASLLFSHIYSCPYYHYQYLMLVNPFQDLVLFFNLLQGAKDIFHGNIQVYNTVISDYWN
jgi:hypothetical protein